MADPVSRIAICWIVLSGLVILGTVAFIVYIEQRDGKQR